jgi:3-phosphoshikimate 1-carboxyvinyltransferase
VLGFEPDRKVCSIPRCRIPSAHSIIVPDYPDSVSSQSWWPAPHSGHAIDSRVSVPGSKSLTNRALILAALSDGPSAIYGALRSRDTELMSTALHTLGVGIVQRPSSVSGVDLEVTPHFLDAADGTTIDVGLAGTVMRFLPPVAGLTQGSVMFDGDPAARRRPMATLIEAMRDIGIDVDDGGNGRLPFLVRGRGHVPGGEVVLDASRSSQFVTALLLSAARFEAGATIHHVGQSLPSTPHIDMTIGMLAQHGVKVRAVDDPPVAGYQRSTWHVDAQDIRSRDWHIEPDVSNALPFIAAAMVTGGRILIERWPVESLQPTATVLDVLRAFGAGIENTPEGLSVTGPDQIAAVDVDLSDIGETAPTMTAICAFASGPCTLRGIAHLRGHETDRLAALEREITSLGGSIQQTEDGLEIEPSAMRGGNFHSYDDHRMATTGAIIGLRVPGVVVENIDTTAKTLPDFAELWATTVLGG